jgi:hypothetical protein
MLVYLCCGVGSVSGIADMSAAAPGKYSWSTQVDSGDINWGKIYSIGLGSPGLKLNLLDTV